MRTERMQTRLGSRSRCAPPDVAMLAGPRKHPGPRLRRLKGPRRGAGRHGNPGAGATRGAGTRTAPRRSQRICAEQTRELAGGLTQLDEVRGPGGRRLVGRVVSLQSAGPLEEDVRRRTGKGAAIGVVISGFLERAARWARVGFLGRRGR